MLKHCTSSNSDLRLGRRPLSPPSLPPRFAICSDTISLSSSCSSSSPHLYSIQDIDIEFSDMGDDSAAASINQDHSSELHSSLSIPAFKPPVPERKISLSAVSAVKERPPLTTPSLLTQLNHPRQQQREKYSLPLHQSSSHPAEISSHQSDLCSRQLEKSSFQLDQVEKSSFQLDQVDKSNYQVHQVEKSSQVSNLASQQLEKSSHPPPHQSEKLNHPLNQSSQQLEKSSHSSNPSSYSFEQSSSPFNHSLDPLHQFKDSTMHPSHTQRKSPPPHVRYGSASPIAPKKPLRELGARHSTSLRSIPSFFTKKPQLKVLKPLSLTSRPLPTFLPARKVPPMQATLPAPKPPLLGSRSCTFTQSSLRVEPEDRQSPVLVQCRWFNSPVPDADVAQFNERNQLEDEEEENKENNDEDSNKENNATQTNVEEDKHCQVTVNVSGSSTEDAWNITKDDMKEAKDDAMVTSTPKSSVATSVDMHHLPVIKTNSPKPPISLKPTISIKSDQESYKYSIKPTKSVQIAGVDDIIRSRSQTPLESATFSPIEKSQNSVHCQSVGPSLSLLPISKSEEAPKYLSTTPTQLISSTPPSAHPYNDNSRSTSAVYSDTPRCTMKVYAKCLAPDIEYKTVSVGPAMTSRELVWLLLSKYRMKHRDPKLFYLTMDVTIRRTGIPIKRTMVLEEEARPAELKTCNPWGECKFSLQMKKGGLVRIHDSVLMEESKYKCLLISEDTTVEDVIRILLNCYGLERVEEVSCFCVYEVANCRERRLGKNERPLSVQSTWPSSSSGRQPSWPGQHQNNWSHQQPRLVLRRATRSVSNQVPEETCVDDEEEDNKMDVSYSSNESTCSEVAAAFTLCPSPSLYPSSTLPLAALMSLSCPPSHFSAPSLSPVSLAADMDIDIVKGPSLGSLSSESNFSDYEHFFYI